jgi:endonuclease/exonuclease/phosphatase family metal-dependent hydrolase
VTAGSGAAQAAGTTVSVATWNVGAENTRNVGAEVKDLMRFADVIGIQELSGSELTSVRQTVTCSSCAYSGYFSPEKEPIVWKKSRFKLLDSGTILVSPRTHVGGKRPYVAKRYINWVKLQDKASGQQFYFINQHLVSSAQRDGRPNSNSPARVELYRKHMERLTALVTQLKRDGKPVLIVGDFNSDYRVDSRVQHSLFPYERLRQVGAKSTFEVLGLGGIPSNKGTFQGVTDLIDYVFFVTANDTKALRHNISASTHGSDHYAFFATLALGGGSQEKQVVSPAKVESRATPSPRVLGAAATPTPSPRVVRAASTPVPAPVTDENMGDDAEPVAVLPEAGVGSVAGGALGLVATGFAFYQYRARRRALVEAMKRR